MACTVKSIVDSLVVLMLTMCMHGWHPIEASLFCPVPDIIKMLSSAAEARHLPKWMT